MSASPGKGQSRGAQGEPTGKGGGKGPERGQGSARDRHDTPRREGAGITGVADWPFGSGGKGTGGKDRRSQAEHGPVGAAAPLDGSWQQRNRSTSRGRGWEALEPKVQESVELLVRTLQEDPGRSKGKGMAGLRKKGTGGKGPHVHVGKEVIIDQAAVEVCEARLRAISNVMEASSVLASMGDPLAPGACMQKWSEEKGSLEAQLELLKKGTEKELEDIGGQDEGMLDEDRLDPEAYMDGDRRWKRDPHMPVGEKIQRSLSREVRLLKAQGRVQAEVEKLETVIELAEERITERRARVKVLFRV